MIVEMPLCELCKSISWESLPVLPSSYWCGAPSWKYIHAFYRNDEPNDPVGRLYHSSIENIRDSAEQCDLCNLILSAVDKVITELDGATEEKILRYNSRPDRLIFELSLTTRRDGGDGFWVFSKSEDSRTIYLVAAIGFCVQDGTVHQILIRSRTNVIRGSSQVHFHWPSRRGRLG
jgi:hypothetical protein